jgi:molybdopterin synthase catalytic subunit
MIIVQQQPFDVGEALSKLRQGRSDIGATAVFVGSVRDLSDDQVVSAMTLEYYPGMTEKALADIELQAQARWPISDSLIVHRFGRLAPGEDIVLVITCSAHREAAFEACQFLMDWLKTKAPFWKLEEDGAEARWVGAKDSDAAAAARWNENNDQGKD